MQSDKSHLTNNGQLDKTRLTKLVNSFPDYLEYVYSNISLPSPTPLQNRVAEIIGANPDRLILEAARGTGKSWIASIYTTWRLLRNVDEKILIISASGVKAIEIATFVRRLFEEVPLLSHIKPGTENRDSVLAFDIQGAKPSIAPSVAAVGITGQITGRRATLILGDDVEVPANSATELMREKLVQQVSEFEALLIPDLPSSVLMLGTPQSMETIYNKLTYPTVILPAQVPEAPEIYDGKLDPWILEQGEAGDATDKVRFPDNVLTERRGFMGTANFKLQYNLDTTLSDAERFPLKLRDLIVHPLDKEEAPLSITYSGSSDNIIKELPNYGFTGDYYHKPLRTHSEYAPYDFKIMSIDPAGKGTDEATYAILGVLNGYVYLLDVGGTREGFSDEALLFFANKAKEHKVNTIVPEANWGGGMFYNLFSKVVAAVYPCTIEEDFKVKGQKELRIIENIEPLTSNHKLIVNYDLIQKDAEMVQKEPTNIVYSLIHQFTHLTRDRQSLAHDDRLDALAIACQYVKDMVMVDTENTINQLEKQRIEQFLNEKIYGKVSTSKPNYLDNY
jgi:hypothetical protein